MRLRNLTPYPLTLIFASGRTITLQPEGIVPRIDESGYRTSDRVVRHDDGWEIVPNGDGDSDSVLLYEVRPGDGRVIGLPDEEPDTYLVVSRFVAQVAHDRSDLLFPCEQVQGADGRIVGARGLARVKSEKSVLRSR